VQNLCTLVNVWRTYAAEVPARRKYVRQTFVYSNSEFSLTSLSKVLACSLSGSRVKTWVNISSANGLSPTSLATLASSIL